MQKRFILVLTLLLALSGIPAAAKEKPTLGMLIGVAGLGDQSFNDMIYAGMIKAKQELDLDLIIEDGEKSESGFMLSMQRLIDKRASIIVANGFHLKDLVQDYATRYPDRWFILHDAGLANLPNVASIIYSDHEGSFLAGALAGMMTKTGKVGFLGGVDIPIIHVFLEGYKQGVLYIDPTVLISEDFITQSPDLSGFRNPAAGYKHATAAFESGIDILYVAAGLTGNGALQAASDANTFAIGVDSDQDHLAPGHVLTSMMKRLDVTTYSEVKKIITGNFTPGIKIYGLKENGIGLSEMKFTRDLIPPKVLQRLDEIQAGIISGRIRVYNYLDSTAANQDKSGK